MLQLVTRLTQRSWHPYPRTHSFGCGSRWESAPRSRMSSDRRQRHLQQRWLRVFVAIPRHRYRLQNKLVYEG